MPLKVTNNLLKNIFIVNCNHVITPPNNFQLGNEKRI